MSIGYFGQGTLIKLYNGSSKLAEDIKVNDVLMGYDDMPRNVLHLYRGIDYMYKVTSNSDNYEYIVNKDHILGLINIYNNHKLDMKVTDYLEKPIEWRAKYVGYKTINTEIIFDEFTITNLNTMNNYYGFMVDRKRFKLANNIVTV